MLAAAGSAAAGRQSHLAGWLEKKIGRFGHFGRFWTFWGDFKIVFETFWNVFGRLQTHFANLNYGSRRYIVQPLLNCRNANDETKAAGVTFRFATRPLAPFLLW